MSLSHADGALQRAERIAREVLRPRAALVDESGQWPEEGLRALLKGGLGGLVVPTEHGGLGLGLPAVADVCEVLGRACASTSMCFGMHSVGTAVLAAKATPGQVERYLRPIARGEHLTTLALSEPGTGSHFYIPQARLVPDPDGDGYRLTGTKSFVTNGGHADSYVASVAPADADAPPGEFSCVIVDGDAPGLEWGPEWDGTGMRGNASRNVQLRNVPVPADGLLGNPGDQIWYVFQVVAPHFLLAMAGTYVGVAAAAVEEARAHLLERAHSHTGDRLARQTLLQHRLGELWGMVARTRSLMRHAARHGDAGTDDALPLLCSAKAEAARCAVTVTNEVLTLLGGRGYARGGPADRHMRDARAAHVMAPTTEFLWTWTGRWLLEEPILG